MGKIANALFMVTARTYRVVVWKGDMVPIKEGGTPISREFKSLEAAAKWLKRSEGECEVFDLSSGGERLIYSGDIAAVYSDIGQEINKRDRERQEADEVRRRETEAAEKERARENAAAARVALQMRCRVCEAIVSREADTCPRCGEPFRVRFEPHSSLGLCAIITFSILLAAGIISFVYLGCSGCSEVLRRLSVQPGQ